MHMERPRSTEGGVNLEKVHLGPNMSLHEQMMLQMVLALRRYAKIHRDVRGIDFTHPRRNPSEIQSAAMGEWNGMLGSSNIRGRYRAFIDRLATECVDLGDVDLSDEEACAAVLAKIESEKGPDAATETLH